jgi:hypothetical protein
MGLLDRSLAPLLLAAFVLVPQVHAGAPFATGRFVAGSVHEDSLGGLADQAVGIVDCGTLEGAAVHEALTGVTGVTIGGQCFDVSSVPAGGLIVVTATPDLTGHTSFFIGFDGNGDGCVGCTVADRSREGTDVISIEKPDPLAFGAGANTLIVFVRAVSLQPDDPVASAAATVTGNLTLSTDPGSCPCGQDFNNTVVPATNNTTAPYPYQSF